MSDAITAYAKKARPNQAGICAALRKAIDKALPKATSKIWHAIPVWFIGENPVVGVWDLAGERKRALAKKRSA